MTELDQARQEINQINDQLVRLLEQRFAAVTKVSEYKRTHQLAILDSGREQQVLTAVRAAVDDPAKADFIQAIFEKIMEQSRAYQAALRKED